MKIRNLFEARFGPSPLDRFKPQLVKLAQEVYDRWDESDIDTYAGGGVCHIIADEFADFFNRQRLTAITESSSFEQHVYCVVIVEKPEEQMYEDEPPINMDEFYTVDIYPYRYESGAGFCWTKNSGVIFDNNDISIELLGTGLEWYQNFEIDK